MEKAPSVIAEQAAGRTAGQTENILQKTMR